MNQTTETSHCLLDAIYLKQDKLSYVAMGTTLDHILTLLVQLYSADFRKVPVCVNE